MARAGNKALVFLSGTGETMTAEATTGADGKTFQIAATSWQGHPWDANGSITVATSSGTVSSTGYTLYRLNGTVVAPTSSTKAYTVSATVLPMAQVSNGHGFTYSITRDNLDATVLGSSWRTRIVGPKNMTAEVQDFHDTLAIGNVLASTENPVSLAFHVSSSQAFDTRMWALLSADSVAAAVDGVVDGAVSFEGAADADGRMVTFTTRGTSG